METKKSRRNKRLDLNALAFNIVQEATQEKLPDDPTIDPIPKGKNPAAVALGHLGGLKGGPARANKLSAKQRKDIAQKAAKVRWSKNK